jgi:hypothetical protein
LLRFPNPGSTIGNFVSVYNAAFERLNGFVVGLDDIVSVIVAANLATSSGYVGGEAIQRSTREDRSRDPLYNQLKMYAELFRAMGWLHPTPASSLNYTFTLFGHQVNAAGRSFMPIVGESVLGISYPSHVLNVKGDFDLRPFASILRTMQLTGGLSRDEMILGPLSATSDRDADSAKRFAKKILDLRSRRGRTEVSLTELANERNIQVNTLYNYTRWPIAVLRDCGWAVKAKVPRRDGSTFEALVLTTEGNRIAQRVAGAFDLRLDQVDSLPLPEKSALSVEAYCSILSRSGFDMAPTTAVLESVKPAAAAARKRLGITPNQEILFSPFQSLALSDIEAIFPSEKPMAINRTAGHNPLTGISGRGDRSHLFVSPVLVPVTSVRTEGSAEGVKEQILDLLRRHGSAASAAEAFAALHANDTRTSFYPLISQLFQIAGYRSDYSRAGVNYQRWDAAVWIGDMAIPIEIKSPTEELFLSTKAIRQALENKVVLLSRGGLATRKEVTSLIVGFKIPNDRGDMSTLIDDVYHAYGMPIGVFDLQSLVKLAIQSLTGKTTIAPNQLESMHGFLNV